MAGLGKSPTTALVALVLAGFLGSTTLAGTTTATRTTGATTAAAPTQVAKAKAKSKAKAKPKKAAKKKPSKKKKSSKRSKRSKRKRGPARLANMPKGYSWPPSKRMDLEGARCLAKLDTLGIAWKSAKRVGRVSTPITIATMDFGGVRVRPTYKTGPFTMDCHLALGLATYLPILASFGVVEARFSRIYGFTRVRSYGRTGGALSRHAIGLAIDLRSFVTDDGSVVTVVDDYKLGDQLLLTVEQELNASGGFRTVLTPGNDPKSHYDHFHVEVKVDY